MIIGEEFNYYSTDFNIKLALKCAEYAMLAYDEMMLTATGYKNLETRSKPPIPKQLNTKLEQDDFINIVNCNYDDNNDITANYHNVSFSLATKPILLNGSPRKLVAVIIRGTDGVEWKGNMDITGASYDPSMNDHYSFKQAEIDLKTNSKNGLQNYLTTYGITNPVYLITGHSRGAAVANLLADTLSQDVGSSNVFAYTFAAPNNTKKPVLRSNIFNFTFEDDFVSQVPLNEWGYRKHGVTITGNVEDLYKNNSAFRADIERYVAESKNMDKNTFSNEIIKNLLAHIAEKWPTVEDYYQKQILITDIRPLSVWGQPSAARTLTLYEFFRKYVAPAAINGNPEILVYCIHPDFGRIARFLVSGDRVKLFNDYIYNVHNAFTYYTAIKYNLFPT